MDKDITKTTFFQYLKPINLKKFKELIALFGVDRYVKKLTTAKLIVILIFGQLFAIKSLKHLSTRVRTDKELQKFINLESISSSQLSRKLRDLPPELFQDIFKDLVKQMLIEKGAKFVRQNLKMINIIDSSTISMAVSQYPWAEFRKTKAGIKIHLRIVFNHGEVFPDKAVISSAKGADRTKMEDLVTIDENALHLFDRAYVDYKKFDDYTDNNILFISRLKDNAIVEVISTTTKIIDGKVVKDSIVRLGKEGTTRMKNNLRLIEIPDDQDPDKIIRIITNDMKRSTQEISDLYRNRWQIELFFKWIKQHLHVKKFYGFSKNAVENQIWTALITYLLLILLQKKAVTKESLLEVQRVLGSCKYEPLKEFIKGVNPRPSRTSRGRRKINYDEIFEFTYQQVMAGETEHLNDLTYDPVIL